MSELNNEVTKTENAKGKIPKRILFAWPMRTISFGVASMLITYVTFYATNYMGLPAMQVGLVFVISKVFDGVTDFVAGIIIDNTKTRLGKARPYELCLIGYWLFIVLLFSAPDLGINAGLVYLFVMYSIVNAIFVTFLNCNEMVYLSNALEDHSQAVPISSIGGMVSLVFTMAAAMLIPQLIDTIGKTREGWTQIALILAVPSTLIGLIRFFFIKELKDSNVTAAQKLSIKELAWLLFHNKYILLISVCILIANIGTAMNIGSYYYTVIFNDIGLASIMSLSMMSIVVVIFIIPSLSKKFGLARCIQVCILIGVAGYLIRLFDVHSIPLLFVTSLFSSICFTGLYMFIGPLVIDCMDFGEWKHNKRGEGIITSAQSVTSKVGSALSAGLVGILLGAAGFDGTAEVQIPQAVNMIIALNSVIPAALGVLMIILLQFYDLDKTIVTIRSDLAERRK
jgi:GPH family glycoside/pentoside/hexuronide:cation symporter